VSGMATTVEPYLIKPDRAFVEELIENGGGDLKQCMQCATCAVVCELGDGRAPFPRKELHWAQWGLRDRLVTDPDVWLCHQCNDCSVRCPRGAKPGDVLAAVRRRSIAHYAIPKIVSRWANDARMLPVLLLIPIVLLGLSLLVRDPLGQALGFGEEHGFYAQFFPHWLLIGFYGGFSCLAAVAAVAGMVRFWNGMKRADVFGGAPVGIGTSLVRVVKAIITHERFGECTAQAPRRVAHLTAFYGFVALYVVTLWAVADLYINPYLGIASRYPFDLAHPMKILANVGGVLLVFGCVKAIVDRSRNGPAASVSTSFDWVFAWLLLTVGATGFVTEVLRFTVPSQANGALTNVAYGAYFVHLVVVFQLLIYLPYSKFAHVLYRSVAMVYAEHTSRHRSVPTSHDGEGAKTEPALVESGHDTEDVPAVGHKTREPQPA